MQTSHPVLVVPRGRTSVFRRCVNRHLRDLCVPLKPQTVINLGAYPDDRDKEGSTYEAYFPGATFRTFDTRMHADPRHIQGDLMDPPAGIGTFDLVIANSVIEHIDRPWKAAPCIAGLVRPGGHLFVAMPWFYPVHEGKGYGDHWRATPSGVRFLFEGLEEVRTEVVPSTVVAVADRKTYWNDRDSAASGFSILMRKPG